MTGMARCHRAATGLRHIPDIQPLPAPARCLLAEPLHKRDHFRLRPVAIPAEPHRLPCRAGFGQLHIARRAALGIFTDGLGLMGGGAALRAKQLIGLGLRDGGTGQPEHQRGTGEDSDDHFSAPSTLLFT